MIWRILITALAAGTVGYMLGWVDAAIKVQTLYEELLDKAEDIIKDALSNIENQEGKSKK